MSIEGYLAVNLLIDYPLLAIAGRACGVHRAGRTLRSAMLASAYGALAAAWPAVWGRLPMQAAALAAVSASALGRQRLRQMPALAACLACATAAAGTVSRWALRRGNLPRGVAVAAGLALLGFAGHAFRRGKTTWRLDLLLEVSGQRFRLNALVDTGNRLTEPLSGQPVLIVREDALRGASDGKPLRTLGYHTIGGEGEMACFRPDGLWIVSGRRRVHAPEAWVALCRRPLPGSASALAPPEFLGVL